jgi:peptidoglycan/xylan/chitin deacetylase (PgdA/CDA1 family)
MFLIRVITETLRRNPNSFSKRIHELETRNYTTEIETMLFFTCDLEISPEARAKNRRDHTFLSNVNVLLDILDKYDINGVFFVEGNVCQNYAELVEKLYKNAHEIGSHGFAHIPMTSLWFSPRFPKFSRYSTRVTDIKKSKNAIKDIIGKDPISFRAPYLAIDENMLKFLEKEGFLLDSSLYNPAFGKISFPYSPSENNIVSEGSLKILEVPITVSPFPQKKFLHHRFPHIFELEEKQMERTVVILTNLFYIMRYPFALFVVMIHPYELNSPSVRSKLLTFLRIMKQNDALSLKSDQLIKTYNLAKGIVEK